MDVMDRLEIDSAESIGHVIGMAAVVIGTAGIILSIALAEGFSLRRQALSDLGAPGVPQAWLFNGTLIVAGALAAIFCASLLDRLPNRYQRSGIGTLLVASVSLVGVGLFSTGHVLHRPASIVFFLGVTLGLALLGYGDHLAGRSGRSRIELNLALLHVLAWSFAVVTLRGVALPELVGGAVFAIWIVVMVIQRGRGLPILR